MSFLRQLDNQRKANQCRQKKEAGISKETDENRKPKELMKTNQQMQKEYYESEQKKFNEIQSRVGCFFAGLSIIIVVLLIILFNSCEKECIMYHEIHCDGVVYKTKPVLSCDCETGKREVFDYAISPCLECDSLRVFEIIE